MATAQVTIKTSLNEAQVVKEALRMYKHAWANWNPAGEFTLDGFTHDMGIVSGDRRNAVRISSKLIADLGLK